MKKFLFFLLILVTSIITNAQSVDITSNDMILCQGESATLTATADLPNRVLNFPRTTNQTIILNNVPAQTIGTFTSMVLEYTMAKLAKIMRFTLKAFLVEFKGVLPEFLLELMVFP